MGAIEGDIANLPVLLMDNRLIMHNKPQYTRRLQQMITKCEGGVKAVYSSSTLVTPDLLS